MFSKKHLCGYSCASCEKGLTDLYGKKVEFMPWGRLPFRDPTERIARVGQGFSKMLAMINPDHLNRYDARNLVTMTHDGKISNPNFYPGQNEMDVAGSFEATRP